MGRAHSNNSLKDPRADPSEIDNNAIKTASEHGHLDVVKLLVQDPRVDPNANDDESLKLAYVNGHVDVVDFLSQY